MFKKRFKLCYSNLIFLKHHTTNTSSEDQKLITLLQSCKKTSEISQVRGLMVKNGLDNIPFTLSKLLAFSTLDINYAASIFKPTQNPNLYMFNSMLRAYSISDHGAEQALDLFNYMRAQRISPLDEFTFVWILKSCANLLAIWTGLSVHSIVLRSGFILFLNVKNTMRISEAHQLFDEFLGGRDLVSWNTLMGGYLGVGQHNVVVDLFRQLFWVGIVVGKTTLLNVIAAAGELACVSGAESLHGYCVKIGFCSDLNVVSTLISMYSKMGCFGSGRRIFDEVTVRDVVLWNCLIDGYAKNGMLDAALDVLGSMKLGGVKPNASTLVSLLSACTAFGALDLGRRIHDYVEEQQLVLGAVIGTALVNMYVKCGLLSRAIEVFERIDSRDVMCWTAMILGCGIHGEARNAITHHRMEDEGLRPNKVTFLAVLNTCSHAGLVTEGISIFRKMVHHYGLKPEIEHYGCIIDLLGRAGLLEDAHKLIKSLPIEGDATAWRALLAACRVHGHVQLAELVKEEMEQVYHEHPADELVLTSTYAIAGRIADRKNILEKKWNSMKEVEFAQNIKKEAGRSTIQFV